MNQEIYCYSCADKDTKKCYIKCNGIYAQALNSLIDEEYEKQKRRNTSNYQDCKKEAEENDINSEWSEEELETETFYIFKEKERRYLINGKSDLIEKRMNELLEIQKLSCEKL